MDKQLSILIVDDHSMVRNGTRLTIQSLTDTVKVHEAKNGTQAIEKLNNNLEIDLILLDIGLPDVNGIDLLKTIRKDFPLIPVIMISASDDSVEVEAALSGGARGFIHKSEDEHIMKQAIQLVLSGGMYFPPSLLSRENLSQNRLDNNPSANDLTPRQLEVIKLLTDGNPNKIIAGKLGCTESTVRVHVTAIFKVLGVSNRTEAAMKARNIGLVD